jgi:transcriptional regulator with XRE-family HTH domain
VTPLPTYDAERFGSWLKRWRASEGLDWGDISERSGLHTSTLHQLARGTVQAKRGSTGGNAIDPKITTLARLAHGLGLDFSYVVSKSGLISDGDRWGNFSAKERRELYRALRLAQRVLGEDSAELHRMLGELEPSTTPQSGAREDDADAEG